MKYLVLALCAAGIAHAAENPGPNWRPAAVSAGKDVIFVNEKTLIMDGRARKIWLLFTYETEQDLNGKKYKSVKQLISYDCTKREHSQGQKVIYSETIGKGDVVGIYPANVPYSAIVPDSVGETLLDYVCALRAPKP